MAKIPRLDGGSASVTPASGAGVGAGFIQAAAQPFGAAGDVADAGFSGAATKEQREAERLRLLTEQKQGVLNEVDAGKRAGDYEESIYHVSERLKTTYADSPDQAPEELLAQGRTEIERAVAAAPNTAVGLEVAQKANSRLDAAMREMHGWVQLRQTQKAKGDLEAQKNDAAAQAGRLPTQFALEQFIVKTNGAMRRQFQAIHGADADKEMHDLNKRITESFLMVRMKDSPIQVRDEIKAARGAVASYLKPEERNALYKQAEWSIEHRGETRQYDLLGSATGDTIKAVGMLNDGTLSAETMIAFTRANENARKAIPLDKSYTPEQRAAQLKMVEKQGTVLEAIDEIRMRGVKFDPVKQVLSDAAAVKTATEELRRYKARSEQLPLIADVMERLLMQRKRGEISAGGYQTAQDLVARAYEKALNDQAANTGLPLPFWPFQDSMEAGNREMNRLLENSKVKNASAEEKAQAWVEWVRRLTAESKDKEISKDAAKRIVRVVVSNETGVDVRVRGDQ